MEDKIHLSKFCHLESSPPLSELIRFCDEIKL